MAPRSTATEPRTPLSRDRILRAAVALADAEGLEALTMRNLAERLGVEAMSLYHHVANKEALLDGAIEVVVGEVLTAVEEAPGPDAGEDWRAAMRHRVLTAREVMLRHPWAPRVIETRTEISLPLVAYFDGLIGVMRSGGLSYDLAHHAMHALGSRALGFTQELFEPDDPAAEDGTDEMLAQLGDRFPHLTGMLAEIAHVDPADETLGWCDDRTEFEFALDLIVDGLEARRLEGGQGEPVPPDSAPRP